MNDSINTDIKNKYLEAISRIYKEQSKVVGKTISIQIIEDIPGLIINDLKIQDISDENPREVLDRVILQYAMLFGNASIEVSKEAIEEMRNSFQKDELPDSIR